MTTDSVPNSPDKNKPKVLIWCDGACEPNPGNGGVGVVLLFGAHRKELSRTIGQSTNNTAEILAAVEGLKALKFPCSVTIYSDSQYLVKTMNEEFSRKTNLALWSILDHAAESHDITWTWVRSHVGNPENERANDLAQRAARRKDVPLFEGVDE